MLYQFYVNAIIYPEKACLMEINFRDDIAGHYFFMLRPPISGRKNYKPR